MTAPKAPSRSTPPLDAIVLAAGRGTRMPGDLPKVLHPVADRPMLLWVLEACREIGCRRLIVVVGHRADEVKKAASGFDCLFVTQNPQLGTGHAVDQARELFKDQPATRTLVLCGDGPLIRPATLRQLLHTHEQQRAEATLATSRLPDPSGYGRIVRDTAGRLERIVEEKDASDAEKTIREVNPSYYCFDAGPLFEKLGRIDNRNAKGEYYLTDVLGLLRRENRPVAVIDAVPPEDVLSINTLEELRRVDEILRHRLAQGVQS